MRQDAADTVVELGRARVHAALRAQPRHVVLERTGQIEAEEHARRDRAGDEQTEDNAGPNSRAYRGGEPGGCLAIFRNGVRFAKQS